MSLPAAASTRPLRLELLLVTVALTAFVVAQLIVTHSRDLLSRPLELDEVLTYLLTSDPHPTHAFHALAGAADTNTPTLYILLRSFVLLRGRVDETTLRLFSFACTIVALVSLYALLRRAFSPLPAACGLLSVWAHPLAIEHTFTARFYALWLAAAVLYALSLRSKRFFAVAATAILLCTTHYFGVLSWALITAADLLFDFPSRRSVFRRLLPTAAGPIALAACLPLLLSQRRATPLGSWIEPFNFTDLKYFVTQLYAPLSLVAVVLIYWLYQLQLAARRPSAPPDAPTDWPVAEVGGIAGLIAFPVIIIAFSLTLQPALLDRYAIPAALAFGPLCAYLASRTSRIVALIMLVTLLALSTAMVAHTARVLRRETTEPLQAMIQTLRDHPTPSLVVFERRHDLYPLLVAAPDLLDRCCFLTAESTDVPRPANFALYEGDMGRDVARFYPQFQLITRSQLSATPTFLVVIQPDDATLEAVRRRWPDRRPDLLSGNVYQVEKEN